MSCTALRVLKSGGVLRIVVPDLETLARRYLEEMQGMMNGNAEQAADQFLKMLNTTRDYGPAPLRPTVVSFL